MKILRAKLFYQRINIVCKNKFVVIILSMMVSSVRSIAQVPTYRFDEGQLFAMSGTTIVSDPTANAGSAFFRSSSSGDATFWYGPYTYLPAGNYVMQVRLKVSANSSNLGVLSLDVNNGDNGQVFNSLLITPSMFKQNNEWQLFSMPFQIPETLGRLEFRGMSFHSGTTDIYMDYINIVPDLTKGYYSDDITIDGKGNIGIHTAQPREALSVNGNIRAKEVKVESGPWPDYVFNSARGPLALPELEKFIKKYKHLPGVPSAAEVDKDGLVIGEVVRIQMQKIEELTQYLIEKDKEINDLKVLVKKLLIRSRKGKKFHRI